MRDWMEIGLLVEAGLFAGLLALFLAWLGMRVVFTLLPSSPRAAVARASERFPRKTARAA
ncbi:MAG TPA: hypothetical protein VEH50_02415 [Methylomirabilota bacterium]|nr:hypothetical protein [Methylomirabilota bacterium]